MNIVAGSDDAFALPMGVTLYSALKNLAPGNAVSLYIIDGGIREQNRRRLTEVLDMQHVQVQLEWVEPNLSRLNGLKPAAWNTQATYLRLLIPELLPEDCQQAIYLDSDLVVEKDLGQLWDEATDDFPVYGVPNFDPPSFGYKVEKNPIYASFGLSPDTPFCNTGMLLMNLKRWRAERIAAKALDVARKVSLPEGDQDAINIVVAGAWGLLDPKWNVQLSGVEAYGRFLKRFSDLSELETQKTCAELLRDPYIIHFTLRIKPWHFICREPARGRFFYYLKESHWFPDIGNMTSLVEHTWKRQNEHDPWMKQLYVAKQDLKTLIPPGEKIILVDDSTWFSEVVDGWDTFPFLEQHGQYWGPPADDKVAITEFERMRESGVKFIVFAWPAFWWLDHYVDFHDYLSSKFRCLLQNSRLVAFDLR